MSRYMNATRDRCPMCGGLQGCVARPLTRKQAAIYDYIEGYVREHNIAPSFDEIALQFGYASLATVHEHLYRLELKGWIRRDFNKVRAITCLVPRGDLAGAA